MSFELKTYLADTRAAVDDELARLLPPPAEGPPGDDDPLALRQAMRRAVLVGGKRLRPCLVVASCQAAGGEPEAAHGPACAVELVHAYSLVHDDLPCMDDDELRRGQPTTHRAFGEATAVLVGNALLSLAFETLTEATLSCDGPRRWALVDATRRLSQAVGWRGMIGGQALDLSLKDQAQVDFETLERCHLGKTAALFAASTALGAATAGATPEVVERLAGVGRDLGLAFQHADDLRDAEFTAHRQRALTRAVALAGRARAAAEALGPDAAPLAALADLVAKRAEEAG